MSNNDTKKPLTVKVLNDKVIRIQSTGYDSINESSLDKMTSKLDKMNIKDGEKEKKSLLRYIITMEINKIQAKKKKDRDKDKKRIKN